VFKRVITDLASHAADPEQLKEAKKFIDMQGTYVDEEAQKLLQEQLQMVPKHVETIAYDPIPWGPGIEHSNPHHAAYLRKFLDDFCEIMMKSIHTGAQRLAVEADHVAEEGTQHLRFALIRAGKFTSTASTKEVESAAASYLNLNVTDTDGVASGGGGVKVGKALVIYGRSGAGKTYLLSKIMTECLKSRSVGGAVVIRFLGTTPRSSNVHALLTSLCEQLRRLYGKDDAVPSDFKELRVYFHLALTQWPTAQHPLTLFIDSVDQLDDSNAGRRLDWLPVTGLPAHVKLVVSTLPDYPGLFQCLSTLQDKLGKSNALSTSADLRRHSRRQSVLVKTSRASTCCLPGFLQCLSTLLNKLRKSNALITESNSRQHCVQVKTISEPDTVLMNLLHLQGRELTDEQRKHVLEAFDKRTDADAAGTPLWLTIVAFEVSLWPSFAELVPISPAVRDLIISFFKRLEEAHGKELVHAALAYITLAKNGVSETELQHLLSLEDSVLASVYEWWVPPVRIAPPLLVTRLLTDLAPYLTRRGDGSGSELVTCVCVCVCH
jgi:RecA/RadA recombinase